MNNKFLILLLLLLHSKLLNAQSNSSSLKSNTHVTITWGDDAVASKESLKEILHDDGKNVFALAQKDPPKYGYISDKVTPILIKYDNSLKEEKRVEYKAEQKNVDYLGTYYIKGTIYILTSSYDSKIKQLKIAAQKYDADLNKEEGLKVIFKKTGEEWKDFGIIQKFSTDNDKGCLIVFSKNKKAEKKLYLNIFDSKLDVINHQEIVNDDDDKSIEKIQYLLSNNGDLFILRKKYEDEKAKQTISVNGQDLPGYTVIVRKLTGEGGKDIKVDLKDKYVSNISMISTDKNNIQVFTTYEDKFQEGVTGFYFFEIDGNTGDKKRTINYPLKKELITRINKLQNDKSSDKNPALGPYYGITGFQEMNDGSTYVIIEKNYFASSREGTTFYSMGFITLKIKEEQIEWTDFIPKQQFFNGFDGYLSILPAFYNNKIYIFYNDEVENEHYDINNSETLPKKFNDIKKVNLMMVEITEDGKMIRSMVGNTLKFGTNVDIKRSYQSNTNRVILCGQMMNAFGGNKKTKLGTAIFD
jgi:hypothetical protein